jgi:hypothetical protein
VPELGASDLVPELRSPRLQANSDPPWGPLARTAPAVLALQRSIGNAAVSKLLDLPPHRANAAGSGDGSALVQRDPPTLPTLPPAGPGAVRVTIAPVKGTRTPDRTPNGMPDRIPPTLDHRIPIQIAGWFPLLGPITLEVEGSGGVNGEVLVNRSDKYELTKSEIVVLQGVKQTKPGSGGNLRLVAWLGEQQAATGNYFSVAALPRQMSFVVTKEFTGATRGFLAEDSWKSDSGSVSDLDEIEISECIAIPYKKDDFPHLPKQHSGYIRGAFLDRHELALAPIRKAQGVWHYHQTHMFWDHRTGAKDVPLEGSGYEVIHDVHGGFITTSKSGLGTTADGIASEAGAGSDLRTQSLATEV